MNITPMTPPINAINAISTKDGMLVPPSSAHINRAGSVKIAPAARDSPAEPMVCTMLFSRMESLLKITRIIPMEITAAGMDADTVIPTLSPKYAFAPPKTTASRIPRIIETGVSSGKTLSAGIYGLNSFSLFICLILLVMVAITNINIIIRAFSKSVNEICLHPAGKYCMIYVLLCKTLYHTNPTKCMHSFLSGDVSKWS